MVNDEPDQDSKPAMPTGKAIAVASVVVLGTAVLVGLIFPALRKPLTAAVIASPIPPIP